MASRWRDWFAQAERDLEQAEASRADGRHEWACFAAQQAAEMAVRALHLSLGQEVWGHVVARLMAELPVSAEGLIDKAKVLDNFYVATRYANGHVEGAPFEHYGPLQSDEAIRYAGEILDFVRAGLPNKAQVDEALRVWSANAYRSRPELRQLGYFGSYARGDWGVGSDLDLVAIVASADARRDRRGLDWDLTALPVPAEIVVFTEDEWQRLVAAGGRFARTLNTEAVWLSETD